MVGCGKTQKADPPPDPALERASETERSGLATSVRYLRRERGSLVIGYQLSPRRGFAWLFLHEEVEARVLLWDKAGRKVGRPTTHSIWLPDEFPDKNNTPLRANLTVPCPASARWVAVQFEGSELLETKKVAIPPPD
jgi:hypothetical protein